MEYEVSIRLSEEDKSGFIYSVRRHGEMIESALISLTGPPCSEALLDEYYGGTMAMD